MELISGTSHVRSAREMGASGSRSGEQADNVPALQGDIMVEGRVAEISLIVEVVSLLERLSKAQHRLARDHRILIRAATQLRLGKSAEAVLADIREQSPELLQDYCDRQFALATSPVRSISRIDAVA
jgi:hypothetical protein